MSKNLYTLLNLHLNIRKENSIHLHIILKVLCEWVGRCKQVSQKYNIYETPNNRKISNYKVSTESFEYSAINYSFENH